MSSDGETAITDSYEKLDADPGEEQIRITRQFNPIQHQISEAKPQPTKRENKEMGNVDYERRKSENVSQRQRCPPGNQAQRPDNPAQSDSHRHRLLCRKHHRPETDTSPQIQPLRLQAQPEMSGHLPRQRQLQMRQLRTGVGDERAALRRPRQGTQPLRPVKALTGRAEPDFPK